MTTDTDVKKWYVVRAVSGQENKIKNYIENEISRLGLESFVDQVLVVGEGMHRFNMTINYIKLIINCF
mgnify:CR=1 FL=1